MSNKTLLIIAGLVVAYVLVFKKFNVSLSKSPAPVDNNNKVNEGIALAQQMAGQIGGFFG
jgi:hypothetical protein